MNTIKVIVEVSARHIHLSRRDINRLFGRGYQLQVKNSISQTGQFATVETVGLKGPKNEFKKIRIVGPERKKSQIELAVTDCFYLGIKPVYHISGDTKGAPKLEVIGPKGSVKIPAIVPLRHIHISDQEAKKYGLENKQKVKVKISGQRAVIFDKVVVRVHPTFRFRLHLETDEGNAAGVKTGDKGLVIKNFNL